MSLMTETPQGPVRSGFRYLLAAFYAAAGVVHLSAPGTFMPVMPGWVPWPEETILFTGACEIAGAIALLPRTRLRWWAGLMLAIYAVAVFPVNINHAMMGKVGNFPASWWYHGPRLALQPVLVWWALYCGGVTDWPFGAKPAPSRKPAASKAAVTS
jgi:uncharacterized membrane protein